MVALITNGHSTDDRGRPFRRRRNRPALILCVALLLVGAGVWIGVFSHQSSNAADIACNEPGPATPTPGTPPPPPLGDRVGGAALSSVTPAALSNVRVRVFNGNGQSGQATHVASELSDFGFLPAPDNAVGNDPIYTRQNLQCQGQIRFGTAGRAEAAAVWLVAPCAELIEDKRTDTTVDLSLGTLFNDLSPNPDAQAVLKALRVPPGAPAPTPDPALVQGAHSARC